MGRFLAIVFIANLLSACASFPDAPAATLSPKIIADKIQSFDGTRLGLTVWRANNPKAVILAVHGMNDYAETFTLAGPWWASEAGITTYAYDQRSFGRSPEFGQWPGTSFLHQDLKAAIETVRAAEPDLPLFLAGHSMGAAVIMSAAAKTPLDVDGAILAAPGVWGGGAMPVFYRMSLNAAATFAPAKTLTGERAARQATDNIEILRRMSADPLVIKETRIKSVLGVVRVMGEAYDASDEITGSILFLMGEKDEIIPLKAMRKSAARLGGDLTINTYPDGWHMLFRDLQGETVWRDVAQWIEGHGSADNGDASICPGLRPLDFKCATSGDLSN